MNLFFDIPYKFYDSSVSKGPLVFVYAYNRTVVNMTQSAFLCLKASTARTLIATCRL